MSDWLWQRIQSTLWVLFIWTCGIHSCSVQIYWPFGILNTVGLVLNTWVKYDFVNAGLSLAHDSRLTILHLCIQGTGKQDWCESVALLLHYLHLVACCWLFSVAVLAYRSLTEGPRPSGLRLHCTLAWFLPATLVLVSNWILAGTIILYECCRRNVMFYCLLVTYSKDKCCASNNINPSFRMQYQRRSL